MKAIFKNAWGYQGDNMNLPVIDVDSATAFYVEIMGFDVLSRNDVPHKTTVLGRNEIQIGLAENGGDPSQDGCAFEVDDVEAVLAEFKANGLKKEDSEIGIEEQDGVKWKVFYIIAPDGLCFWLGEQLS